MSLRYLFSSFEIVDNEPNRDEHRGAPNDFYDEQFLVFNIFGWNSGYDGRKQGGAEPQNCHQPDSKLTLLELTLLEKRDDAATTSILLKMPDQRGEHVHKGNEVQYDRHV